MQGRRGVKSRLENVRGEVPDWTPQPPRFTIPPLQIVSPVSTQAATVARSDYSLAVNGRPQLMKSVMTIRPEPSGILVAGQAMLGILFASRPMSGPIIFFGLSDR
jgi:hypothetical protein